MTGQGIVDEVSEKGYLAAEASPLTRRMLIDAMDKVRSQKVTAHGLQSEDPHITHPQGSMCFVCGRVVR